MRYPAFRRQHLFLGSGVIEAGCKTAIGSALKTIRIFWTVRGANAILALRCCHFNRRFETIGTPPYRLTSTSMARPVLHSLGVA